MVLGGSGERGGAGAKGAKGDGIQGNSMAFNEIPWNFMEFHETSWKLAKIP